MMVLVMFWLFGLVFALDGSDGVVVLVCVLLLVRC